MLAEPANPEGTAPRGDGPVPVSGLARRAAVLACFRYDMDDVLRLVLIERSPGGRHGGQLGLPGGNIERTDSDALTAAIRETCEEIGTSPEDIDVLDTLPEARTMTSGYRVQPFVARIRPPAGGWTPQAAEVARVLEVDVARLAAAAARGEQEFTFMGSGGPRRMPTRTVDGLVVWGLTLRILEPVLADALGGRWPFR